MYSVVRNFSISVYILWYIQNPTPKRQLQHALCTTTLFHRQATFACIRDMEMPADIHYHLMQLALFTESPLKSVTGPTKAIIVFMVDSH